MLKLSLMNKKEQMLSAYLFTAESVPRAIIIVCHGFRGGKENGGRICQFAEKVNKAGFSMLAFDFSGSGESDGDFSSITLSKQAEDLAAVIDYVDLHYNWPIILLGRSFGGSTVLAAGPGDKRVKAFIFWSTPVRLKETFTAIISAEYKKMANGQSFIIEDDKGKYLMKSDLIQDFEKHNMRSYLKRIGDRPSLIIHGAADELVDPENARDISNNLNNADLFIVDNADHRFLSKTEEREDITLQWLDKHF